MNGMDSEETKTKTKTKKEGGLREGWDGEYKQNDQNRGRDVSPTDEIGESARIYTLSPLPTQPCFRLIFGDAHYGGLYCPEKYGVWRLPSCLLFSVGTTAPAGAGLNAGLWSSGTSRDVIEALLG